MFIAGYRVRFLMNRSARILTVIRESLTSSVTGRSLANTTCRASRSRHGRLLRILAEQLRDNVAQLGLADGPAGQQAGGQIIDSRFVNLGMHGGAGVHGRRRMQRTGLRCAGQQHVDLSLMRLACRLKDAGK